MPFLLLLGRDERIFRLRRHPLTIGRGADQDVILQDPQRSVSRTHARVSLEGDQAMVTDLGSRNGTRVNGVRLEPQQPHPLAPGARLEVGIHTLKLIGEEAQAASSHTILAETRPVSLMRDGGSSRTPEALEPTRQRLSLLYQLCYVMQQQSDPRTLLERFLQLMVDTFQPDRAFIGTFDPEIDTWTHQVSRISRGKVDAAFRLRKEVLELARKGGRASMLEDTAQADAGEAPVRRVAMCGPLIGDGVPLGILYLDDDARPDRFQSTDLEYLGLIGWLAGQLMAAALRQDLFRRRSEALEPSDRLVFGRTPALEELSRRLPSIARVNVPVLLLGETGTGKSSFAREIHQRSSHADGPFIKVNCAAIPESLLEAELFGYAPRSGIANADPRGKPGRFELAHGGTLFLDEIGDMPLPQQAKLLTALEDREIYRLGATRPTVVNVRLIAATARPIDEDVQQRRFRADLYHRLSRVVLTIPPLRERLEDLSALAGHLLERLKQEIPHDIRGISAGAMECLRAYDWPGNLRELENVLAHAMIECPDGSPLLTAHLPERVRRQEIDASSGVRIRLTGDSEALDADARARRDALIDAIQRTGSLTKAARELGFSRQWTFHLARQYGIEVVRGGPR